MSLPTEGNQSPALPARGELSPREQQLLGKLPCAALRKDLPPNIGILGEPLVSVDLNGGWTFFRPAILWLLLAIPVLLLFAGTVGRSTGGVLIELSVGAWIFVVGVGRNMYFALKFEPAKLWVCRYGIFWQRKNRQGSCLWEDIQSFREVNKRPMDDSPWQNVWYSGDLTVNRYFYIAEVQTPDGEKLILRKRTTFDSRPCGLLIRHRLRQALLPGCIEALENGKTFHFGPFEMTKTQLIVGDKRIDWCAVAEIYVKKSLVRVRLRDGNIWTRVKQFEISHLDLFLALAKTLISTKTG